MQQSIYTTILAPNASMMSGPGTNTIVLGRADEHGALVRRYGWEAFAHL